jgi:lipopolysaccharide export LptBFGC system permease protein LptF
MKENEVGFMDILKKITRYYFFAFIFVSVCLFVNQSLILRNVLIANQLTVSQKIMLMVYSIPSTVVMASPFAVCIGFVQGLVEINIFVKMIKKLTAPVLALGLIISAVAFLVTDYAMPKANESFNVLYRTALLKNNGEQPIVSSKNGPRAMSSRMVVQEIKSIRIEKGNDFERKINIWKMELNKKYSIPLGALFLSLFALPLSLILKGHKKIGFCICIFSCILYWALLMHGQTFSINKEKYGVLAMWMPNIVFLCISCVLYLCYKKTNNPPASMRAASESGFNVA